MNNSHQTVLVLDFGGLYKGLIASIVRKCKVRAMVLPYDTPIQKIKEIAPIGIILTGGPHSVYKSDAPHVDEELFDMGVPILGICYGMQLMAQTLGGKVESCKIKECGTVATHIDEQSLLFDGIEQDAPMLMSHSDCVVALPKTFKIIASTEISAIAAMSDAQKKLYGVQFHPEVERSKSGAKVIENFLFNVCNAVGDYTVENFMRDEIEKIRAKVGDAHVILGLSGGLDSCVCAKLLEYALPNQLTCVFVDNGFLRNGESQEVLDLFAQNNLKCQFVNAQDRFLSKLVGITDPEQKRKIIGQEFVRIFEEIGGQFGKCYFAQGTIQADVVESGVENCAVIKSHHNVGGLPQDTSFAGIIEPLRTLFKNEVIELGQKLGLNDEILHRQPFPGPGLSIRIIGEVTKEKLAMLRHADKIYTEELKKANIHPDQYFAVVTDMRTVGIMGDDRAYNHVIALRAVTTTDFMTCEYVHIPYQVLDSVTTRIVNEVKGVIRVVYDITGKPPATIEWE